MSLNKIALNLLMVSIIMLPFTAMPYNKELLRQMHGEGAFYPLFFAVFLYYFYIIRYGKIIVYEKKWFGIALLLIATVFAGLLINYDEIAHIFIVGRSGLLRFTTQLIMLLFGLSVALCIQFFVSDKKKFDKLMQMILVVFVLIFIFAFLELLAYEIGGVFLDLYKTSTELFSNEWKINNVDAYSSGIRSYGLSSVSQEPSHLCFTFSAIGPYFLLYAYKKKRKVLFFMYIAVAFLSFSTSFYYVLFFQLLLIYYYIINRRFNFFGFIIYVLIIVSIGYFALYPYAEHVITEIFYYESKWGGNTVRIGSMYGALMIWLNNNILFGVGLGQNAAYLNEYVPYWTYINYDLTVRDDVPGVYGMLARVIADCGILGLIFFVALFFVIARRVFVHIESMKIKNNDNYYYGVAVFISVIGVFINISFSTGDFNKMTMWFALGLALSYIRYNKSFRIISPAACGASCERK